MNTRAFLLLALVSAALSACTNLPVDSNDNKPVSAAGATHSVVPASDVKWGPLNPARGDKGPSAGNLWSDRTETRASGFLVKFSDDFSSPPHIHNVTYRGVVISGLVHNDDPGAEAMWMPAGSFWTQPAGEVHITAAKGGDCLAYIEIEQGPYLVLPAEKATDSGERPVNVHASNIVWLDASNTTWVDQAANPDSADGAKLAFLWGAPGDNQASGSFVKLPAGFIGTIRSHGASFHAVVIKGRPDYQVPGAPDSRTLEPGSYFGSSGKAAHLVSCPERTGCILYVRIEGRFDIIATQPER